MPLPPKPRPMRRCLLRRVNTHDGHEHADLIPACEQARLRFGSEAADVRADIWGTRQSPIQHISWLGGQVPPRGAGVSGPHANAESRHARDESAVEGVVAPGRFQLVKHIRLRLAPPIECKVLGFAFVVPPEGHAIAKKRCQLLSIPRPDRWVAEIEFSAFAIVAVAIRLAPREDPPLLRFGELERIKVAEAGLADACKFEVQAVLIMLEIHRGLRKEVRVGAEVGAMMLPLLGNIVVRLFSVPLEIRDESVRWVASRPEAGEGILDVGVVLPPPA
mmetsp:Transcript_43729/g.109823  ORF Transcript_43729/g.109823 Transcript_43729/m.109823 type:complete len:276 (+) Transcript_43729:675-1502(+)